MFACIIARAEDDTPCAHSTIYANVLDHHGNPLEGLSSGDFRLKLDKRPFDLENVQYETKANRVVIVLDTSGSMGGIAGREKWEAARTAVATIIRIAPPRVPIALVAFSDKVRKAFGFGESRLTVMDWLAGIRGDRQGELVGRTMLFDSISAADGMLEPHREGDTIYAITDGGDNQSSLSAKKLQLQLLRHQVRLFAFVLDDPLAPKEDVEKRRNFFEVVENTGGFIFGGASDQALSSITGPHYRFDMPARERVEAQTALLIAQLIGSYRLDINAKQALPDEAHVSLEVINERGKRRKDVTVLFPRRLLRCTPGVIGAN